MTKPVSEVTCPLCGEPLLVDEREGIAECVPCQQGFILTYPEDREANPMRRTREADHGN